MSCYFFTPKPNPNATKRLFCFPYAGGQASIYFDWHEYFADDVEVVTIQLPGRGARFLEPLMNDLTTAVSDICRELAPYFDKPFSVFGHSNGALFAFEMIKQLKESPHIENCQNLFLSAKSAPKMQYLYEPLHIKHDVDFKKALIELGGTPNEILENQEILDLLLPMIKSDFKIGYEYIEQGNANKETVPVSTTLFAGEFDSDISYESIVQWQEFIKPTVDYVSIKGGHFFVHEQKETLINHIKAKL